MRFILLLIILVSCNTRNKEISHESTDATVLKKDTIVATVPDSIIRNTDSVFFNSSQPPLKFKTVPVSLAKGVQFNLSIPEEYHLNIASEGLRRLRFLAWSPDKRLFATDMYDKSDNRKGKVLLFTEWNEQSKSFGKVITFLDNLRNPNQVSFYGGYIYVAETDKLSRYKYNNGEQHPNGSPEVIAAFPDYGLSYKYGGWHLTRSIAFHSDKLYVSVGSSCNACIENEDIRATITEMNPDGSEKKIFARGLRNSVGMKWIGNSLWVTGMGRDLIGPDKPEDLFQRVDRNEYYGWPFYFQYKSKIYTDHEFSDSLKAAWVKPPPVAFCGFKAHSAPLGFEFLSGFADQSLKDGVLVCLHGSTSVWRERGNSIVKVGQGNKYMDIVSGFLNGKTEAERFGRPCDIIMKDSRSFFFTDDHNGVLYYMEWSDSKLP